MYHRLKTDQNGFVTGVASSSNGPVEGEAYPNIMDDAEYQAWGGALRRPHGGYYQWQIVDDELVEFPEQRFTFRFEPALVDVPRDENGSTDVNVSKLDDEGNIDTSYNQSVSIDINWYNEIAPMNFTFAGGQASIAVSHGRAGVSEIRSNSIFLAESPFKIRVYTNTL